MFVTLLMLILTLLYVPVGDQCDYAYMIQYDNSLSYGGTELLPPVASAMECLAACEALTSSNGCYAMDYDFTTQSCYKHATAFLTGDPGLFAQRSHWRYPCDGKKDWRKEMGKRKWERRFEQYVGSER